MRTKVLSIFALALAACVSDPVQPVGHDIYVLQSVAGVALPAPYSVNLNQNDLVVADSILFREDGTGYRQTIYQEDDSTARYTSAQGFTWTRTGNQIAITFDCPLLASCIAGPHLIGTIDEASITITESVVTRHPLVYRRSGVERLE